MGDAEPFEKSTLCFHQKPLSSCLLCFYNMKSIVTNLLLSLYFLSISLHFEYLLKSDLKQICLSSRQAKTEFGHNS